MNITIERVTDKKGLKSFVHFPNELYKSNPYYVPQLEIIDMATFDKKKNHAFEVCRAEYFLAKNENGKVVGRVAAIINSAYNASAGKKMCRFGWIDFVEDSSVPKALLDAVEIYAKDNGMDEVSGPEGFLEFDVAGVLVEGYDKLPTAYGKYNAPYYDKMITALGYSKLVDWVEYQIDVSFDKMERHHRASELLCERYGIRQVELNSKKDIMRYIHEVFEVANESYANIYGFSTLTEGQIQDLISSFYYLCNPEFVSIIVDSDDRVVAFCIWLPSMSKALQKAKGHLLPFGIFHIIRALRHNDTVDTLLMGVRPDYQNKGINALFFDRMYPALKKYGITMLETTRELEINNDVQNLAAKYDRRLVKRARAYVKTLL